MEEVGLDDEMVQEYLTECREHLSTIDNDLLAVEAAGTKADEATVNRIFRAAHSIKGGAGVCGLVKVRNLAHRLEDALDLIRTRRMEPTTDTISVLLSGFDRIRELLGNYRESDQADTSAVSAALADLTAIGRPGGYRRANC
jgi:two-component system chemotaxis sensor kinase CheA